MTQLYQSGSVKWCRVSCCGVRYLPCRRCGFVSYRPLPLARVAPPATGGAPLAPQTLTCGLRPFPTKNKCHGECIILRGIYWHILHNLIQCNANRQSVAFVKSPEYPDNRISDVEEHFCHTQQHSSLRTFFFRHFLNMTNHTTFTLNILFGKQSRSSNDWRITRRTQHYKFCHGIFSFLYDDYPK